MVEMWPTSFGSVHSDLCDLTKTALGRRAPLMARSGPPLFPSRSRNAHNSAISERLRGRIQAWRAEHRIGEARACSACRLKYDLHRLFGLIPMGEVAAVLEPVQLSIREGGLGPMGLAGQQEAILPTPSDCYTSGRVSGSSL